MDTLGDIPGFKDLSLEAQRLLVANMRDFRYPPNAIICYKQQPAIHSWILLSGTVVDSVDRLSRIKAPSFFHSSTDHWDITLICQSNVLLLAFPRKLLDYDSASFLTHITRYDDSPSICQPVFNHDIPLSCRLISDLNPTSILEVGCGFGFFSRFLSDLTSDLTLSDPNSDALLRACDLVSWSNPNISLSSKVATAEALTFSSTKFDLIVTRMALHHMSDIDLFFVNMLHLLRPNGLLLLTDLLGSDDSSFHVFLNSRESLLDSTHQTILSHGALSNYIEAHGLSIVKFYHTQVLSSLRTHSSNHRLTTSQYVYLHDWLLSSPTEYKSNINLMPSECGDLFWIDDRFTVALKPLCL